MEDPNLDAAQLLRKVVNQFVESHERDGSPCRIGWGKNRVAALEQAIAVLEHSNAPQCDDCKGFTTDKLTDVDGTKLCDECLLVWQQDSQ